MADGQDGKMDKKKKKKKSKMKGDFQKMDLSAAPEEKAALVEAPPDEKSADSKGLEHKEDIDDVKGEGGAGSGDAGEGVDGKERAPPVRNPNSEVTLVVPTSGAPHPPEYEPGDKDKKPVKKKGKFSLSTTVEASAENGSRPGTPNRPLTRIHANEKAREEIDETKIHDYAWNGESIAMEQLIGMKGLKDDQGKNYIRFLDSRDKHGNTALMLACTRGFHAIAELLIKSGAGINLQNFYGWTAMMFAVSQDNEEIVKLLLSKNANLRLVTPVDRQALDFASSPEVRKLLKDVLDRPTKIDEKLLLKDEEEKLLLRN
jgi:hypothetical protein